MRRTWSQNKNAIILRHVNIITIIPTGDAHDLGVCWRVYEESEIVQYIINGLPAFSHVKEDQKSF